MAQNTPILGKIKSSESAASLDAKYGPYASKAAANAALGENGDDVITAGLTVGITQSDGSVKEFWYQPNQSNVLELVEKQVAPVSDAVLYTEQELSASQKSQARSNIGAGTSNFSGNYDDLTNKPTIPTVPTISTDIDSDATSDTKTASPKAVKTFVEGKGYLTQHQDISGKVDKVANAQEDNFASFDANGGIKDSNCNEGSFIKGVKQNGTTIQPVNGVVDVTVQDGEDGKSAYDLYVYSLPAGTTPLSPEAWLASLKANIGEFLFVPTDAAAVTAMATIGQPYSSAIDPQGKNVAPSQNTLSVILLMNAGTSPDKTMMIATQDDGSSGFEFVYAGDLQSAMPSNVVTQDKIINDLNTGGATKVLSAEQGVVLKQEVDQLDTNFTLDLYGNAKVHKSYVWSDGYVTSPSRIVSSTTSQFCQPIRFKAGEKLTYKTGTGYDYGVVEVEDNTPLSVGDSGFVKRIIIAANVADRDYTYTFEEDKWVVITVQKASYTLSVEVFKENSVDEKLDNILVEQGNISERIETLEQDSQRMDDPLNTLIGESFEDISIEGWLDAYISTRFVVNQSTTGLKTSQPMRLTKGDTLVVKTRGSMSFPVIIVDSDEPIAIGDTISSYEIIFFRKSAGVEYYKINAPFDCYAIVMIDSKYPYRVMFQRKGYDSISSFNKTRINCKYEDFDTCPHHKLYINANNIWGTGIYAPAIYSISAGAKIRITANDSWKTIYALLKRDSNFNGPVNSQPGFCDWCAGRQELPAGESVSLTAYDDCFLYVYYMDTSQNNYFPKRLDIYQDFDAAFVELSENVYKDKLYKRLYLDNADEYLNKGVNAAGNWAIATHGYPNSMLYRVKNGDRISVKANTSYMAFVAFLSDFSGKAGDPASFANGTSERITIPAGESRELTVTEDCYFYVYSRTQSLEVYLPDSVFLFKKKHDDIAEAKMTRQSVNLLKEAKYGFALDARGNLTEDHSACATEKIKIFVGWNWYQKARYIHCCCYNNGVYGFCADKLLFLDESGSVVGTVTNVSAAVEIPVGAIYAAVQFPGESSMNYIAINNQSILHDYCEYNEDNLDALHNNIYENIVNSEGAISHMIDIALDYIPMSSVGLGYGDIATAYDDIVEPVPSEFTPSQYVGEKMQINCSAFVMLCLEGISYKNSRYNDPDGKNIGDGYKFDQFAEYNYFYTKAPYQYIYGADYGKMYANKLAKYAYDRGFLYIVKDDFSNVNTGDVLFTGSMGEANFFRNISHTLWVYDTELLASGGKRIYVFETGYDTGLYSYRAGLYGARFPLPWRNITFKDIVSGFIPIDTTTGGSANEEVSLGTYSLLENITGKNQYTLIVNGEIPDDINLGIKLGNNTVLIERDALYNRRDGVNVKHFHFAMTSSVNAGTFSLFVQSDDSFNEARIKIDSVRISRGFFENV